MSDFDAFRGEPMGIADFLGHLAEIAPGAQVQMVRDWSPEEWTAPDPTAAVIARIDRLEREDGGT